MLSKKQEKLIVSLSRTKCRDKTKLFIAEGARLVSDLIKSGLKPYLIIATKDWKHDNSLILDTEHIIVSESILKKLSTQKTPQNIIVIFNQPDIDLNNNYYNSLILGLDGIQDPGNFGAILRIADWFGIECLVCSKDTVDIYNPKVVQSSMGSIARVKVQYVDFEKFCIDYAKSGNVIYGTFLNGENIYTETLKKKGLIIIGNEGQGIRPAIEKLVNCKISIPSFSVNKISAESLNVSVATGIICSEFLKQKTINNE
jgi:TrmH family RNA methyltransferase